MPFIGRQHELEQLHKQLTTGQFELSIIYGRRRVGKTYLIQQFLSRQQGAYFTAVEASSPVNLTNLSAVIYSLVDAPAALPAFQSFSQAMKFLFELSINQRIVFAIDEYPYLASAIPSASSELQALIDAYRERSQLFLILCGSSMNFMENQVLGYKSPLYGRRTAQYKITAFDYLDTARFLTGFSLQDRATLYGITGGVAAYLTFIKNDVSLRDNIIELFLETSGRLYEEPSNLLKQELRDPKTYNDILLAIAGGASRSNQIATKTGLHSATLNNYLKSLIELGIVKKQTPVGEKQSRKSIYMIADSMFRFWYRFIPYNASAIQLGLAEQVYDQSIEPRLSDFMGAVFEQMCIQYLEWQMKRGNFPFLASEYGNWWGNNPVLKRQEEIDIVVLSKDQALYAECKWRNEKTSINVLNDLVIKSDLIPRNTRSYMVFSKSGFTFQSNRDTIRLVNLDMLYGDTRCADR